MTNVTLKVSSRNTTNHVRQRYSQVIQKYEKKFACILLSAPTAALGECKLSINSLQKQYRKKK